MKSSVKISIIQAQETQTVQENPCKQAQKTLI